jgi:hypothetical protein
MTQKLVGDGCSVCNPALALDHANETIEQLESDLATAEQDSRQKQALIERLEKAVKEWRDRCTNLLDFIEHAPVSSGVCCCGEDMENHVSSDHSPVDQWSWNIHLWSREIKTAIKNMEDAI